LLLSPVIYFIILSSFTSKKVTITALLSSVANLVVISRTTDCIARLQVETTCCCHIIITGLSSFQTTFHDDLSKHV